MTLLKTIAKVDNLDQLRQRKVMLKAKMEAERTELIAGYHALRSEFEPAKLATNVARSFLGMGDKDVAGGGEKGFTSNLSGPLQVAADIFIREPRLRLLFKFVMPLLATYLPQLARKAKNITPEKAEVYGYLRKRVSGLRKKFRRKKNADTADEPFSES